MNIFEIEKNIFCVGPGIFYKGVLIISDIHIGYEEALNKQGVMIPRLSYDLILDILKKIVQKLDNEGFKIDSIIINGDLKHEFGTISKQEWKQTLDLLDYLSSIGKTILIRGNHDTIIKPILDKKNIEIMESLIIDDILITHGHKPYKDLSKVNKIIIGHEHPAIGIRYEERREVYKAFIKIQYKSKVLIVMPSLFPLIIGNDLLKEKPLSCFLKDMRDGEVLLLDNNYNIYYMGKISFLKNLI